MDALTPHLTTVTTSQTAAALLRASLLAIALTSSGAVRSLAAQSQVASAPASTAPASTAPAPNSAAPAQAATPRRNLPPFVAPFLVTGKGVSLVEFSMRQTDVRTTRRQDLAHLTYRYGIAPRVELRATVKSYSRVETVNAIQDGFNGIELGTRIQLIKQARGYFNPIPRLALQLGTSIPTAADRGPAPTMALPSAGLATNWRLGPADVILGGATIGTTALRGTRREVRSGFLTHFHHFNPDVMLSSDWQWRTQPDAAMLHHARVGVIVAVLPTVQVEARYVVGLNGVPNDRGIQAGFAVRP